MNIEHFSLKKPGKKFILEKIFYFKSNFKSFRYILHEEKKRPAFTSTAAVISQIKN